MKKKRNNRIVNSMIFAIITAVVMNALCILLVLFTRRYAAIEPHYYTIFVAVSVGLILLLNLFLLFGYGKPILWMRKAFVLVGTLFIAVSGVATYYVYRINSGFDGLTDTSATETVNYSVITLNDNLNKGVITSDYSVGFVEGNQEFNQLLKSKLESISGSATVATYENYADLLRDYLQEPSSLDMVVVPSQYTRLAENMDSLFQERLNQSIEMGNFNLSLTAQVSGVNVLEEPFTLLIMGINENLADSIILASINPQTMTITLSSIARDSLVPIACYANNSMDKLNHAHARSRQCLIDTIEDYVDTDIDFYFEADFYALIKIVDALGGLELTSPITFTGTLPLEDESGFKDITIHEGTYVMNGEEVLTFARERHHFLIGDYQRQINQQYIIKELLFSIINKAKTNPNILVDVLDAGKDNIVMNLSMENHIAPLLGFALNAFSSSPVDMQSTFTINQTQIVGEERMINGTSYTIPLKGSVLEVRSLIDETLGIGSQDPLTTLSIDINNPYTGFVFRRYAHMNSGSMYSLYGNNSSTRDQNESNSSGSSDSDSETSNPTQPDTSPEPTSTFTVPELTNYGGIDRVKEWANTNG
ncbi:hypothetical protein AOC36_09445 [Erysipelothrix larvae]|uniref:Cell envelope-related transcriptional attenuator domain-containing protein n=1 Tax=Erysipelothrix larvae TaxID=1514105 RepID=A0A109UHG6_9FIRM|nr:LCP family protein [Erysipelothrix larvae]AMC94198.1 hypothetical protein AOC36_09445 [Erysipelothrix larvae]